MGQHPVVWFEVMGKDGGKLRSFYGELFGWKINADNPMKYGMVETGSKKGIPGGVGEVSNGGKPWTTFYVETSDLAATLARAEKLGGKSIMPPTDLQDGTAIAVFQDPEGHVVGLVKGAG